MHQTDEENEGAGTGRHL